MMSSVATHTFKQITYFPRDKYSMIIPLGGPQQVFNSTPTLSARTSIHVYIKIRFTESIVCSDMLAP